MQSIAFIAPIASIGDTAKRIALELGLQDIIHIAMSALPTCLAMAKQFEQQGADVIVARGWSADLILNSTVRTPVVHIPVGIQDFATMLTEARQITGLANPQIAFITFPRVHWDLATFAQLLEMNLHIYSSNSEKESIATVVKQAIEEGADIIVGGQTSAYIAEQFNIHGAVLASGEDSIRQALLQAGKVVYARKMEQMQSQHLRTVLDISRDGIISINNEGYITLVNMAALHILRLTTDPTGMHLKEILTIPRLQTCLETGCAIRDEVVHKKKQILLVNALPITYKEEMTGAIITFQETQTISTLETKIRRTVHGLNAHHTFTDILGASPQILTTLSKARRYAQGHQSVLIVGETGTGKELFAQALHNASPYRQGPFVAVNCGALSSSLLESELFGYDSGSFTGASSKGKAGLFELAHKGTLFLDEISEMDISGQTRLLRALEERSIMRIGGNCNRKVDLRIIAATNVNLAERVQQGSFRQDLYYRIKVLTIILPPLRHREGDTACLAEHFLRVAGYQGMRISPEAMTLLENHTWPGNVRELRYVVDSLSMDCIEGNISTALVHEALHGTPLSINHSTTLTPLPQKNMRPNTQEHQERQNLLHVLEQYNWHQGHAAQHLKLNRSTLYRRMKKLGINKHLQ